MDDVCDPTCTREELDLQFNGLHPIETVQGKRSSILQMNSEKIVRLKHEAYGDPNSLPVFGIELLAKGAPAQHGDNLVNSLGHGAICVR